MNEEAAKEIANLPKRVLDRRGEIPPNVPEMLDWVKDNQRGFREILNDFDVVVDVFNHKAVESVPPFYENFLMVKTILGDTKLPPLPDILREGSSGLKQYIRAIQSVRAQMLSGDVGYHKTPTDQRTLVIASVFVLYEELIKSRPEFKDKTFEQDRITEGLMEISSQRKEMDLFDRLAAKDGMNWVNGYDRFSPAFRQSVGLE